MPPITWKNVAAPTALGASKILDSAGKSVQFGLGKLGGLASQISNMQASNQTNTNKINTEAALAGISGLGSTEELAAAQESGVFNPANLPAGVDQGAIRKAMQNQNVVIDDRLSKEFAFQNRTNQRADAPANQLIANAVAANNLPEAQSILDASGNVNTSIGQNQITQRAAGNLATQRAEEDRLNQQMIRENAPLVEKSKLGNIAAQEIADINQANQLAELPVQSADTPEQQALGKGAAFEDLMQRVPKAPWNVTDTDSGGSYLIDSLKTQIPELEKKLGKGIPEHVLIEANKLVASGGGEDDELFSMDKSVNPVQYLETVEKLMKERDKSSSNRIKRGAVKRGTVATKLQAEIDALNTRSQYNPYTRR